MNNDSKRALDWAAGIAVLILIGAVIVWAADLPQRTCQEWASEKGLGPEATILTCETGEDASGEMTEVEYQRQQDEALELAYEIINSGGGL